MHFTLEKPDAIYTTTNILGGWVVVSLFVVRNSKTISQIKAHTYITGKMDGDSENCLRLHGLHHEQWEAQHGGGSGGDDGANSNPNLRLEYKTIQFAILGISVSQKTMKLQNACKICIFCNSEQFPKGGPME